MTTKSARSAKKAATAPGGSLAMLTAALASGEVEVIDLTQTLSPDLPTLVLPPELGQCTPFRIEEISRYDERGPAWYWNTITLSEHTGTHFDAPVHWISGRDLPNNTVDAFPAQSQIAPACVIDCSEASAKDPDFLLQPTHIEAWEDKHGTIPKGCWVLMRTDWSKRDATGYANLREDGAHTPGPSPAAIRLLVEKRGILGFGTETIGTDAGQAHHLDPPYPAHYILHGNGRYGLQCLANLDKLPAKGALIIAPPLKIRHGSGSPLRVLALVEKSATGGQA